MDYDRHGFEHPVVPLQVNCLPRLCVVARSIRSGKHRTLASTACQSIPAHAGSVCIGVRSAKRFTKHAWGFWLERL
jgi:hypothetical protein